MATTSLSAQKITSNSRLPRGLANDPPSSLTLEKSIAAVSSRLKSNPPPAGPSRKNSSYNFKHTDPAGTSLLTVVKPLIAPAALSPTSPGVPPGTPLLHAAATCYTPPIPPNLDLSEIAQPVPVRPNLREGTSYCHSLSSPLPTIQEDKQFNPDIDIVSPRARLAAQTRGSGFFTTFVMDGVEDLPILGRRRRSGSGGFDEGWPLPPPVIVERGHNTPGDPRRSSLIAEEDVGSVLGDGSGAISADPTSAATSKSSSLVDKDHVGNILRDGSGASSAELTTATTSKSSSQTNLSGLLPVESSKTSLSLVEEEPSSTASGTRYFDFSPSFKASESRKLSAESAMSPHTRQNSLVAEAGPQTQSLTDAEIARCEDAREGEDTDNEDWHSIRSHMTRVTTFDANSILYNYSMATPNMALPTPEEMKLAYQEKKKLRNEYLQGLNKSAMTGTSDSGGENGGEAADPKPTQGMLASLGMKKTRSAAYPFPRMKSDKKGKGKEKEGTAERPSMWRDLFNKSSATKTREKEMREAEAVAQEQAEALERMENGFNNRKVDIGSSVDSGSPRPNPNGGYRSPWVEDENHEPPKIQLIDGGDNFHYNFATSSSASAIPSLSSSTINFLRNTDGSYRNIKGAPAWQYKKQTATLPVPGISFTPAGQVPIMSSALAKVATGSALSEKFSEPAAEEMWRNDELLNERPLNDRQLSHESPRRMSNSSSDSGEEEVADGSEVMRDAGENRKKATEKRYTRPGLESRLSTVRDLHVRRASTVELVHSGATQSRVVVQESRGSQGSIDEEERLIREAKLKKLTSRKRSLASGRKKSVATNNGGNSDEEGGMKRRISTALQGGFGGRKMTTDGRGGIGSTSDIPAKERTGIWSNILGAFTKGEKNDDIAAKRRGKRPALGSENGDGAEGAPMRKKTSFWRRRIEPDENGKLPMLKRVQEAIKRGQSSAMPAPA